MQWIVEIRPAKLSLFIPRSVPFQRGVYAPTKGSAITFLCQALRGVQKVYLDGEIFWEVSSAIITGNSNLWFLAMDRIIAPYRRQVGGWLSFSNEKTCGG